MNYFWENDPAVQAKRHERRVSRFIWGGFLLVMAALALEWLLR